MFQETRYGKADPDRGTIAPEAVKLLRLLTELNAYTIGMGRLQQSLEPIRAEQEALGSRAGTTLSQRDAA